MYNIVVGKAEGRAPLEDIRIYFGIILKWMLKISVVMLWIGLSALRNESVEGPCFILLMNYRPFTSSAYSCTTDGRACCTIALISLPESPSRSVRQADRRTRTCTSVACVRVRSDCEAEFLVNATHVLEFTGLIWCCPLRRTNQLTPWL
jgi:hypothetical protein